MSNGSEVIVEIGQQTTEAVGENREALAEELERIRRDEDLSEHAKGRLTDEAHRRASKRHAEIVDRHEQATKEVLENDEKRLFRLSYPEGVSTLSERQAYRDSYRDASFKVLNLPEDTLSRIMTRGGWSKRNSTP